MNHPMDFNEKMIRDVLNRRRQELIESVAESARSGSQTTMTPIDEVNDHKADADRLQQIAIDDAQTARDLTEMSQVEAALLRLDDHQYGLCADCGAPIAPERLRVQPAATRCTACQALAEQRGVSSS